MQLADVESRVEKIRAMAGDYEVAHGEEDSLYTDVLAEIAAGGTDSPGGMLTRDEMKAMAAAALKSQDIEFARYTA